jgi:hypothetical protein
VPLAARWRKKELTCAESAAHRHQPWAASSTPGARTLGLPGHAQIDALPPANPALPPSHLQRLSQCDGHLVANGWPTPPCLPPARGPLLIAGFGRHAEMDRRRQSTDGICTLKRYLHSEGRQRIHATTQFTKIQAICTPKTRSTRLW